jgi:hypothetical protein
VWNHAVFSKKTHDRLSTSDVAQQFFAEVNKHFTGDSALIQACVSQNSFRNEDDLMMATGKILAHISFEAQLFLYDLSHLRGTTERVKVQEQLMSSCERCIQSSRRYCLSPLCRVPEMTQGPPVS